jgi:hypothetical protein
MVTEVKVGAATTLGITNVAVMTMEATSSLLIIPNSRWDTQSRKGSDAQPGEIKSARPRFACDLYIRDHG